MVPVKHDRYKSPQAMSQDSDNFKQVAPFENIEAFLNTVEQTVKVDEEIK